MAEYIDITPTWEEILPTLLAIYVNGSSKGRIDAFAELVRMAKLADLYVKHEKDKTDV